MISHAPHQLPFFVYGTLLPGQPNYSLWDGKIRSLKTAVLENCDIYDLGYYPMLVPQNGGLVTGKLIAVAQTAYEEILARIDILEEYDPLQPDSSTYKRVQRAVKTSTGKKVDAWVYEGENNLVNGSVKIANGNWLEHIRDRHIEIETWWWAIDTMFGHHN